MFGLAWRARLFVETCQILLDRYDGQVPADREALLGLPGVGHYVAGAVRCFGFGLREPLVDANTIRLAGRVAGVDLDARKHRAKAVQRTVYGLGDQGAAPDAYDNFALLDLAILVCKASDPAHSDCPIIESCATGRAWRAQHSIGKAAKV